MTWSTAELRAHIERKIDEATLEASPFPHIIIENFFPDDVFRAVLEYNLFRYNAGRQWISKRMMRLRRLTTPYDHRMQINFNRNEVHEGPPEALAFWNTIEQTFVGDDWFPKLICAKFPWYFQLRFGEALGRDELWKRFRTELFLQRHEPNYHIGPHTDISTRICTCIFSFADRPGFEDAGTLLMRHKDPLTRCWGDAHFGFEDFEVVKVAPYKPNNFLLFFKTRQSFHAVRTVTEDIPNQRYGMQFQLYEPQGGVFTDLSRPGLMLIREEKWIAKPLMKLARTLRDKLDEVRK
jgi:hypothetical protein